MATIADQLPDLAKQLGVEKLSLSAIHQSTEYGIVTLRENPMRTDGDLIGYIPPTYSRFAYLSKEGRGKCLAGETWLCRVIQAPGKQTQFLIPHFKIDVNSLLLLDEDAAETLTREIRIHHPDWLSALSAPPQPDPQELEEVQAIVAAKDQEIEDLIEQREQLQRALLDVRRRLVGPIDDILEEVFPTPEPEIVDLHPNSAKQATDIYLADANLFINAEKWKQPAANQILRAAGGKFSLATTGRVFRELQFNFKLPEDLHVLMAGEIDAKLLQYAEANKNEVGKKASSADLSLIQLAINDERVKGIITEDPDILNMHPQSIIKAITGRDVECIRAPDFVNQHKKFMNTAKKVSR